MMARTSVLLLFLGLLCWACRPSSSESAATAGQEAENVDSNPAAKGFDAAGSDARAIAIADSVMLAMGGRKAWDATRYLQWNLFCRRYLLWDKYTGDVRIEIPADSAVYIVNLHNLSGMAREGSRIIEGPDTLRARLQRASSIWINDSYWLVMPYKLKDSGLTLRYLGRDTTQAGRPAWVLQLTFKEVGDTPQNKYHIYVDADTYLVRQWAYFPDAGEEKPDFIDPWDDYRQYGQILLSGNRGDRRLTDIKVLEKAPEGAFSSLQLMFSGQ